MEKLRQKILAKEKEQTYGLDRKKQMPIFRIVKAELCEGRDLISRKNQPQAAQLFRQWYVERAQERIARRVKYFAETMGVNYNRVLISDLRVRWSSCTPKNNLNFNW